MVRPAGWMKQLTGRDAMRSPGAPSHRREVEREFWQRIATGITSERAAHASMPIDGTRMKDLACAKPITATALPMFGRTQMH